MENQNTLINQNLFHTQVLKDALKGESLPPEHRQILQAWVKDMPALRQKDKAAWHDAFLQKILVGVLGYQFPSGDAPGSLKKLTESGGFFDAALGRFEKEGSRIFGFLKLTGVPDSDAISDDEHLSLLELARQQTKETWERQFFILAGLDEVRVYSLIHKRNACASFSLSKMADDAAEYQRFHLVLGADSLLSGETVRLLHESVVAGLQHKLTGAHSTIRDIYGSFQSGVSVGINDVFVINKQTYDRLVKEDPNSETLFRLFYGGDSMKRWHSDYPLHWLIYTPKGQVDIDAYPAIKKYLEPFRSELEKRGGDQKWYELDHTEKVKTSSVTGLRLGTGRHQTEAGFALGEEKTEYGDESHYLSNADYFLFGLLNSSTIARLITATARRTGDGAYEILANQIEALPVPDADGDVRAKVGRLASFCMEKAQDRRDVIRHFHGMTAFHLSPEKLAAKMSDRLLNWFTLDFDAFRNEVIAAFGVDISADNLPLWTDYFEQQKSNVELRGDEIAYYERELDQVVYGLFDLDEDDIALIERA